MIGGASTPITRPDHFNLKIALPGLDPEVGCFDRSQPLRLRSNRPWQGHHARLEDGGHVPP
jgi:hypothetical protein